MQDIQITGVDENKIQSEPPPSLMKRIYFRLSATPPREWAEIFAAERKFPRHSRWREAKVLGSHIEVYCPLEELQRHLDDLKEDVKSSNLKYRGWLDAEKRRQGAAADAEAEEKQKIHDVVGKLKF